MNIVSLIGLLALGVVVVAVLVYFLFFRNKKQYSDMVSIPKRGDNITVNGIVLPAPAFLHNVRKVVPSGILVDNEDDYIDEHNFIALIVTKGPFLIIETFIVIGNTVIYSFTTRIICTPKESYEILGTRKSFDVRKNLPQQVIIDYME